MAAIVNMKSCLLLFEEKLNSVVKGTKSDPVTKNALSIVYRGVKPFMCF